MAEQRQPRREEKVDPEALLGAQPGVGLKQVDEAGDTVPERVHEWKEGADLRTDEAAGALGEGVKEAAHSAKETVQGTGEKVGEKAEQVKEGTKEAVSEAKERAGETASKTGEKAEQVKGGIEEGVKGTAEEARDRAGETASNTGKKAEQVKGGIEEGVKGTAEEARDRAGETASNTGKKVDEFKEGTIEASEQAKDRAGETAGNNAKKADQVKEGTKDAAGKAKESADETANKAENKADEVGGKVSKSTEEAKTRAGDTFDAAKDNIGATRDWKAKADDTEKMGRTRGDDVMDTEFGGGDEQEFSPEGVRDLGDKVSGLSIGGEKQEKGEKPSIQGEGDQQSSVEGVRDLGDKVSGLSIGGEKQEKGEKPSIDDGKSSANQEEKQPSKHGEKLFEDEVPLTSSIVGSQMKDDLKETFQNVESHVPSIAKKTDSSNSPAHEATPRTDSSPANHATAKSEEIPLGSSNLGSELEDDLKNTSQNVESHVPAVARKEDSSKTSPATGDTAHDTGFGVAGKDRDVKAPIVGQVGGDFPEEYGAADDEFVTRTNYAPTKDEKISEHPKNDDTSSAADDDVGPGTLVSLKNKIAGIAD